MKNNDIRSCRIRVVMSPVGRVRRGGSLAGLSGATCRNRTLGPERTRSIVTNAADPDSPSSNRGCRARHSARRGRERRRRPRAVWPGSIPPDTTSHSVLPNNISSSPYELSSGTATDRGSAGRVGSGRRGPRQRGTAPGPVASPVRTGPARPRGTRVTSSLPGAGGACTGGYLRPVRRRRR